MGMHTTSNGIYELFIDSSSEVSQISYERHPAIVKITIDGKEWDSNTRLFPQNVMSSGEGTPTPISHIRSLKIHYDINKLTPCPTDIDYSSKWTSYVYNMTVKKRYVGSEITSERFLVPRPDEPCEELMLEVPVGSERDDDNLHAIHGFPVNELDGHPLVHVKTYIEPHKRYILPNPKFQINYK